MTQYKTNSLKPGKPYKAKGPRALTHTNCAIDVTKQAKLYAEWVNRQSGLMQIHIYQNSRSTHRKASLEALLDGVSIASTMYMDFISVDPKDYLV